MINHFTITLAATTQQALNSGISGNGATDGLKFLSIQADAGNAHEAFVGNSAGTVSSSDYGIFIPKPVSSIPAAPIMIVLDGAQVSLPGLAIVGTQGEKFHLLVCY